MHATQKQLHKHSHGKHAPQRPQSNSDASDTCEHGSCKIGIPLFIHSFSIYLLHCLFFKVSWWSCSLSQHALRGGQGVPSLTGSQSITSSKIRSRNILRIIIKMPKSPYLCKAHCTFKVRQDFEN